MAGIDYFVTSLINKIDRRNLFFRLNDPESYISLVGGSRPKKPPNSFSIFRKNVCNEARRHEVYNMRVVTKTAIILWNQAQRNEKDIYRRLSSLIHETYFTEEV
ncbi:unnamed protein product [Rhizophagus irregularis]|uniref:MATA-HMG n=2 Tax=Rhizophagus irregularis TaxID=588596 RepID=A0A915ZM83_9GLOM|nr:unnamed protein product [Rhizophagus irregularis]